MADFWQERKVGERFCGRFVADFRQELKVCGELWQACDDLRRFVTGFSQGWKCDEDYYLIYEHDQQGKSWFEADLKLVIWV